MLSSVFLTVSMSGVVHALVSVLAVSMSGVVHALMSVLTVSMSGVVHALISVSGRKHIWCCTCSHQCF